MHPEFQCNNSTFVSMEQRLDDFRSMQVFLALQLKKYLRKRDEILADCHLTEKQKSCQILSAKKRMTRTEVNAKATEYATCCIHFKPLRSALWAGICALHLGTNEFLRLVQKIELLAEKATRNIPGVPLFFRPLKKKLFWSTDFRASCQHS